MGLEKAEANRRKNSSRAARSARAARHAARHGPGKNLRFDGIDFAAKVFRGQPCASNAMHPSAR